MTKIVLAFLSLRRHVRRLLFPVPWKMLILQECGGCLLKLSSEAQKKKTNLCRHETNFFLMIVVIAPVSRCLSVSLCVRCRILGVQQTSLSDSTAGRWGLHSFFYLWMLSEFHFLFLFYFFQQSSGIMSCEIFLFSLHGFIIFNRPSTCPQCLYLECELTSLLTDLTYQQTQGCWVARHFSLNC